MSLNSGYWYRQPVFVALQHLTCPQHLAVAIVFQAIEREFSSVLPEEPVCVLVCGHQLGGLPGSKPRKGDGSILKSIPLSLDVGEADIAALSQAGHDVCGAYVVLSQASSASSFRFHQLLPVWPPQIS